MDLSKKALKVFATPEKARTHLEKKLNKLGLYTELQDCDSYPDAKELRKTKYLQQVDYVIAVDSQHQFYAAVLRVPHPTCLARPLSKVHVVALIKSNINIIG